MKLSGHSHYFVFDQKEHSATIGACSNIMPYSGFAILSILNDEIIIDGYNVTDKEATRALQFKV